MKAKELSEIMTKPIRKTSQNPMLSELSKPQAHTIFQVNNIEPSSAKLRDIQQWKEVVEEPSISESDEMEKESSESSYLS